MAFLKQNNLKESGGWSLMEVLMVIFIFTLISGALTTMIIYFYRSHSYNLQQLQAIQEGRHGVDIMIKEIREAKYGDDGAYPLVQAGDFTFIFYSNIDSDESVERIRYFLDGSDFKKGVVEPSGDPPVYALENEIVSVLSSYVRNSSSTPVFKYYNGDWPEDIVNNPLSTLTRLSETKLMHLYLVVNVDPTKPPDDFVIESDTQIRNLKTNL